MTQAYYVAIGWEETNDENPECLSMRRTGTVPKQRPKKQQIGWFLLIFLNTKRV